jgi:hypothetical protein
MADDNRKEHLRGALVLGAETVRALLLVNGGAAAGLLTFYGNFDEAGRPIDRSILVYAMTAFGAGLILAVLASGFGYFSQLVVASGRRGEVPLRTVAVACALASAVGFAAGVYFGILALP